jgi:hypothetical protein
MCSKIMFTLLFTLGVTIKSIEKTKSSQYSSRPQRLGLMKLYRFYDDLEKKDVSLKKKRKMNWSPKATACVSLLSIKIGRVVHRKKQKVTRC